MEIVNPDAIQYVCPQCGSADVQLCWPVWIHANKSAEGPFPDVVEEYEVDTGAAPYRDSGKGWCHKCAENILVRNLDDQEPGVALVLRRDAVALAIAHKAKDEAQTHLNASVRVLLTINGDDSFRCEV